MVFDTPAFVLWHEMATAAKVLEKNSQLSCNKPMVVATLGKTGCAFVSGLRLWCFSRFGMALAWMLIFSHAASPPDSVAANSALYYWGFSGVSGMTNTPTSLTNAIAVAIGREHVLGLRSNGTVIAWGDNSHDQTNVPPGLTDVVQIAAGQFFSAALSRDGQVTVWGDFGYGWNPPIDPMLVGLGSVVSIACGQGHMVALKADGTVAAWGPSYLQLTNFAQLGLSNIVSIGAGDLHAMAVRADGTVVGWQYYGQQVIPDYVTNVVAVSGGFNHSLALRADGTVVAWGSDNSHGQLTVPVTATNIIAIAARAYANAALRADGIVIAWGQVGPDQYNLTNPPPLPSVLGTAVAEYGGVALVNSNLAAAPFITGSPLSQSTSYGASVAFTVFATGWGPLSYQWYFNGTNSLATATNRTLVLTNVKFDQSGTYSARVTNSGGVVWSQPATLTVVPGMGVDMVPRVRLEGEVGLTYRLDYVNAIGDSNAWIVITNVTLTVSPYYYLDQSAVGQPQRFYRATLIP